MELPREETAIVFIDPQNEVLSDQGSAWPVLRESLQENNTIENMERIFKAAKAQGFEVFISPHYFYPTDKGWKFNGPVETSCTKTPRMGLLKATIENSTQRILGCTILAAEAGEMIGIVQAVMMAQLPATTLRDAVLSHPTMVEGLNALFAAL
jgi:Pyridine nucleotide-disulphide oxidoreductase, dimerisation domain/Isochorismatase family